MTQPHHDPFLKEQWVEQGLTEQAPLSALGLSKEQPMTELAKTGGDVRAREMVSLDDWKSLSAEDINSLSFDKALMLAYRELSDDCMGIYDPQPSLIKGIASIWGMGGLFGPQLVVNPTCMEDDVNESLNMIWTNVGSHMWSAIDRESALEKYISQ